MRPMSDAPRDGTTIVVRTWFGDVRARYVDCQWLRDRGEDVPDCWRPEERHVDDDDIELANALGWLKDE